MPRLEKEGYPRIRALSLVCAIPGIGDVIGAVRSGTKLAKVAKAIGNGIRMAQKSYVTVASAETALELAGDAKMEYAVNGGKMTGSIMAKKVGAVALAGLAVVSGKSLVKDVGSIAKLADVQFSTRSKEAADAVSGKNYQYGGVGGCFTAGTKVKTQDGGKNIEDVKAGDYVLAENPDTGEQECKKVVRTFIHEKYELVHVKVGEEEIETTVEHPFYVEGAGFVPASELKAGDIIRTSDGENLPILKVEIELLEEPVLVYNFEVEDFHTYYVSEIGVLVHNTCPVTGDGNGLVKYGELDSLGRTTGVDTVITKDMIGTGSPAKSSIKPAGFGGKAEGHARGHLLGKQLGGSGNDSRNLVTLYQNPVNHPVMSSIEAEVRKAVENGQIVRYTVTPIYEGNNLIPSGITIRAKGNEGLNIYQTILNRK